MYGYRSIFFQQSCEARTIVFIRYPQGSLVQLVDFAVHFSAMKHPDQRTVLELAGTLGEKGQPTNLFPNRKQYFKNAKYVSKSQTMFQNQKIIVQSTFNPYALVQITIYIPESQNILQIPSNILKSTEEEKHIFKNSTEYMSKS